MRRTGGAIVRTNAIAMARNLGDRAGLATVLMRSYWSLGANTGLNRRPGPIPGQSWPVTVVVECDGRAIGSGKPGPITRDLLQRFHRLVREEG